MPKSSSGTRSPRGVGATALEWTLPSPPNFDSFERLPRFDAAAQH
jgi:cytochrome c oxidase subunit I